MSKNITLTHVGTLCAARKVRVSSELGGVVERLYFEEGQRVKKGQLLAEIGTSSLGLQVKEARAALEAARARLQRLEAGSRPEEISVAEAALMEARAALAEAEQNYSRMRHLHHRAVVSQRELDAAKRMVDTARARVKEAEKRLELARKGPRAEDKREAAAMVMRAEAALDVALDRFRKSKLHAPCSGIIAYRGVEEGEVIGPGFVITQVVDDSEFEVVAHINEEDLPYLKKDAVYAFLVDAIPGKQFRCRLKFIAPAGDPKGRSFRVEFQVLDTHPRMADGMSARLLLPSRHGGKGISVPVTWLVEQNGRLGLFVVKDGRVEFVPAELGNYFEREVEIVKGISMGDLVITNPSGLRPGQAVLVKDIEVN